MTRSSRPAGPRDETPAIETPRSRGSCYGFEIRSTLEFRFLRAGGNGAPLGIEESEEDLSERPGRLIQTWSAIPGRRALTELYRRDDGYRVRIGDARADWFHVSYGSDAIRLSTSRNPAHREVRLWTTPITVAAAATGAMALHAAAVDLHGGAVLLVAPSGSGKTTTATGFHARGHRLLSEDLSCCVAGSPGAVLPGPGLIKLRHDVASRFTLDDLEPVVETTEKVFCSVDPSARGTGDPVPLRAIVFLGVHSGAPELRDVPAPDALRDLWGMSFYFPDDESRARCFEELGRLVDGTPVHRLTRRLDSEALDWTVETLAARFGG
jgi:hypothetical protein